MNKFFYYTTATFARAFFVLMWVFLLLMMAKYIISVGYLIEPFFQWVFCEIEDLFASCRYINRRFDRFEHYIDRLLGWQHAMSYTQNIVYCFVMYWVFSYYKAVFKNKLERSKK